MVVVYLLANTSKIPYLVNSNHTLL